MKADYKNWVPKYMVNGLIAGTIVFAVLFVIFGIIGLGLSGVLSRDEDAELNSLNNQRNILVEYANANNHEIVGESFDDNVSGMHFNREGISKIYEQVENKAMDAIIVKDLSRLGRHRTQTAMFIDYLREHDVRVLSVTENIDTSNEDDDLMIGFKGIFNDMYARDISKKIRAGYKQK